MVAQSIGLHLPIQLDPRVVGQVNGVQAGFGDPLPTNDHDPTVNALANVGHDPPSGSLQLGRCGHRSNLLTARVAGVYTTARRGPAGPLYAESLSPSSQ